MENIDEAKTPIMKQIKKPVSKIDTKSPKKSTTFKQVKPKKKASKINIDDLSKQPTLKQVKPKPPSKKIYTEPQEKVPVLKPANIEKYTQKKDARYLKQKLKNRNYAKRFLIGRFYAYTYDSKCYEEGTLEYFDASPLVLVLNQDSKYMWGLNFHYLPPQIRLKVIKKIAKKYKENWDSDISLKPISWNDIKKEVKQSKFMIKMYIKNRITNPKRIFSTEMLDLVDLRSEQFIGINATQLWKRLGLL